MTGCYLARVSGTATIHTEALGGATSDAAVSCQLVVVEGPDMGRAIDLTETHRTVGSDADCDLPLSDAHVSGQHLSIAADGRQFMVRDLGSRNGTLYRGSKLTEARVPAGATLKLGRTFVRVQPRPQALELPPSQSRRVGDLVAESLAMREVFAVLELASRSEVTMLLEGDTGVGKELAARCVHELSERRAGPFVAMDCGALPPTLLDSELFGHVRGAFTGASGERRGAFVRADGGTLYLDELDSIPPDGQARLLRALESRTIRPVGSDTERTVDIRIVASTRRDLRELVAEGAFRPDLYYRLSVVRVVIPPLRDRREDIAPIVAHLLRQRGWADPGPIEGPNLERLFVHDWPGNARELRNVVDRALALSPDARTFGALRLSVGVTPGATDGELAVRSDLPFSEAKQQVVDAFERRYLRDVWERCDGNVSAAARAAGVDRKHFRSLLVRHGILEGRDGSST